MVAFTLRSIFHLKMHFSHLVQAQQLVGRHVVHANDVHALPRHRVCLARACRRWRGSVVDWNEILE